MLLNNIMKSNNRDSEHSSMYMNHPLDEDLMKEDIQKIVLSYFGEKHGTSMPHTCFRKGAIKDFVPRLQKAKLAPCFYCYLFGP